MNLPRAAIASLLALGLFSATAWASTEPIPGVDVIVRKNPGGNAITVTTDKTGTFTFAGLAAGNYTLSITLRQAKAIISTTRSNIRHPNLRVVNGAEVATVDATLGSGDAAPVEIAFTKNGAKITGTVTSDNVGGGLATSGTVKPATGSLKVSSKP
jgi:hypothetical protein